MHVHRGSCFIRSSGQVKCQACEPNGRKRVSQMLRLDCAILFLLLRCFRSAALVLCAFCPTNALIVADVDGAVGLLGYHKSTKVDW